MEGNRTHCPLPSPGSPPFPSLFSTFHSTTTPPPSLQLRYEFREIICSSDTSNVPLNASAPLNIQIYKVKGKLGGQKNNPSRVLNVTWDAGKHLPHQLVYSDTRSPDTPPNKDHRREISTVTQTMNKEKQTEFQSATKKNNQG